MSHVVNLQLRIKSLADLEVAAQACGLELVKQDHYKWFGRFAGDAPLPEGFTEQELGLCEYALRVKGNPNAYEVGVVRSKTHAGEFELLWDFWQRGYGLQDCIEEGGNKLKREYAAATTNRVMRKQGYRVHRSVTADGKIVLKARR